MGPFLLVVAFVAALTAVIAAVNARGFTQNADRVQSARLVTCAGAAGESGPVRLIGRAEPMPDPRGVPRAPLTGSPYAWCSAQVTREVRDHHADGTSRTRTMVLADLPGSAFLLRDDSGTLVVAGDPTDWHDLPPAVDQDTDEPPPGLLAAQTDRAGALLAQLGVDQKWAPLGGRLLAGDGRGRYHLTERVVAPGTPVVVTGELRRDPAGVVHLGGVVLASTESPEEVVADSRGSARRARITAIVAAVIFVVAVVARVIV